MNEEVYVCPAGHQWQPFREPIGVRPDCFVCPVCGAEPRTEEKPREPLIRLTWRRTAAAVGFVLLLAVIAYGMHYLRLPRPVLTLRPHGGQPVTGLAFSPDCTLLATSGRDCRIGIWEVPSGRQKLAFTAHHGWSECVAFAPNGELLVSAGDDARVAFWDPQTGRELGNVVHAFTAIAVSPDSKRVATGGSDGWLRVWDIATSKELHGFQVDTTPVLSVAYSPDGKQLAAGDFMDIVHLLDAESGRQIASVTSHRTALSTGLAFSPDGKWLAADGPEKAIQLVDTATGQVARQFPRAHSFGITCMAFSNDGKYLASASGGPTQTGELIIWDVARAKELITLRGHDQVITAIAFSRTGKYLATASWDGTAKLWDMDQLVPPAP
jgi:WD40 repeat protein